MSRAGDEKAVRPCPFFLSAGQSAAPGMGWMKRNPGNDFPQVRGPQAPTQEPSMHAKDFSRKVRKAKTDERLSAGAGSHSQEELSADASQGEARNREMENVKKGSVRLSTKSMAGTSQTRKTQLKRQLAAGTGARVF